MIKIIYCILGMSNTGKSTIARETAKRINLPLIISYTSRPIRPNEIKDVDYHYVDNKHFDDNFDDFIEMREYTVFDGSVWKYGYKKSDFNSKNGDFLVVIETDGYNSFKQFFGKEQVLPIFINSPIEELYKRAQKRGDNPKEIVRRLEDDQQKFKKFLEEEKYEIVQNHKDLNYAINQIIKIINKGE